MIHLHGARRGRVGHKAAPAGALAVLRGGRPELDEVVLHAGISALALRQGSGAEATAPQGARELRTSAVRRSQRARYPGNGEISRSPASVLSRSAALSSRKKSVMAWPLCRT
ncbi:hypothetical protein GCM10009647_053040 [Streptomyces sanglieri]